MKQNKEEPKTDDQVNEDPFGSNIQETQQDSNKVPSLDLLLLLTLMVI